MKISKKWTKLDNRGESVVEFVIVAFLIVMITIFVICIEVHAAEPATTTESRTYHTYTKYNIAKGYCIHDFTFTLTGNQRAVGYKYSEGEYFTTYMLYVVDDSLGMGNSHWINKSASPSKLVMTECRPDDNYLYTWEVENEVLAHTHTDILVNMFKNNAMEFGSYNFNVSDMSTIVSDVPLFDNPDALEKYLTTGDNSGMVNKPAPDYNHEYDFSNYQYDINIPLPELSQVTHNGFKVDNVDGYYIDVIMETNFCGVKVANAPLPVILPDYNWVYKRHTYNFTIDDRAINNSVINIKDIYGVDSTEVYWNDFIDWSSEYNTVKKISTYKWYDIGLEDSYKVKHIYNEERFTALGKEECLRQTLRRKTLFYVRLYDKNAKYGQWVKYEINDFVENDTQSSNVTTGVVDGIGIDGKPIVKDEINGYTDSSGNISYRPNVTGDTSVDTANSLSGFKEALNSFTSAIGQLPELVNKLLGFLPWWATALLGCVIVVCVILRVVGR